MSCNTVTRKVVTARRFPSLSSCATIVPAVFQRMPGVPGAKKPGGSGGLGTPSSLTVVVASGFVVKNAGPDGLESSDLPLTRLVNRSRDMPVTIALPSLKIFTVVSSTTVCTRTGNSQLNELTRSGCGDDGMKIGLLAEAAGA